MNEKQHQNEATTTTTSLCKEHSETSLAKTQTKTANVFTAIQASWGSKWTANFNASNKELFDVTGKLWGRALAGLTDEQIKDALDTAINTLEFPPTIAQFKKLALGIESWEQAYNNPNMVNHFLDSWELTHDSEHDMKQKFKGRYLAWAEKKLTETEREIFAV